MLGRIVGGMLGAGIGKESGGRPIAGALIGAGTLFAARRLLPQRYAVFAATAAAGYLTRKWADRAEARQAAQAAHALDPALADAGAVDTYAGSADVPPDGQTMGDALPPAIPTVEGGKSPVLH